MHSPIRFGGERPSPNIDKVRRLLLSKAIGSQENIFQRPKADQSTASNAVPHQFYATEAGAQHSVGKTKSSPNRTPRQLRGDLSLLSEPFSYVHDKNSSSHGMILSTLKGQTMTGGNNDSRDRPYDRSP